MTYYTYVISPVGQLLLAGQPGILQRLHFSRGSKACAPDPSWIEEPDIFAEAARQLEAYFSG